jgi:hypothetical protein
MGASPSNVTMGASPSEENEEPKLALKGRDTITMGEVHRKKTKNQN